MQKSVGLHYDHEKNDAPRIILKGEGELADKINKLARELNVPLFHDEILTEILYNIRIDREIPEYLYDVIAEVYAFTYRLLKENG